MTVPPSLVDDVDRAVTRRRYPSRSAVVAEALARWARAERDSEWDEYYASTSLRQATEERGYGATLCQVVIPGPGVRFRYCT